jgi:uncharacterized protein YyaL (SSP411 family)
MANRLAGSTSPYLLQHKDNPVDWQEWGDDAFADAAERDVPILLSVGYSACHWCHVMAHESFEDPETAGVMNQLFVNVKVDREERPDVDSVYMEAVQAMSGQGGWPMTVFLAPDGRPFFAGTYFPNEDRHGMPSFRRVLAGVSDAWTNRRDDVTSQATQLTEAINRSVPTAPHPPGEEVFRSAYEKLVDSFDAVHGGFGGAPKFPQQPVLEFLLRIRKEAWAERADEILTTTLTEMADGGIHDHLGGGFARYSVDSQWLVPHFEKMLYDNAQLARVYLWAGIELRSPRFIDVARATLDYMLAELRHPGGGFYSAEDADSEGVEGKFYVWDYEELVSVLGEEDGAKAAHFFGVTPQGNFEGTNVLHRPTAQDWDESIESIRDRLLVHRGARVRPGLDDKVVTSWNGLALRALAEAGAALKEPRYLDAAMACAAFLEENLIVDGELQRSWREKRAGVGGFLEDHAAVAVGLLALYAATGEHRWYGLAEELIRLLPERFHDPSGGFFDTPADGPELIKRPKNQMDNPLPSGNGLAAEALLALASYTGEAELHDLATGALQAGGLLMDQYPSMVGRHLAVAHSTASARELAIVGRDWEELAATYWSAFRPETVLAGANDGSSPVPLLADRYQEGTTRAFLCRGFVCELPVDNAEALAAQLG